MKWTTEVAIDASPWKVGHDSRILTIGSCFADNMGQRMRRRLLRVQVNPFGALYNPMSMANALEAVLDGRAYTPDEMIESCGRSHCIDFASVLSGTTAAETADNVNTTLGHLREALPRIDVLMATFGSTHVFEHIASGRIAGNCHKLPAAQFCERDVDVDEIVARWDALIHRLTAVNPRMKVLLTVSPVRHKAYGLHADRLSKSRLLLAADELCHRHPACTTYFPAYEILTDELRDYRFYADDMVHPSEAAADYIFERWAEAFCTPLTRQMFADCLKFTSMAAHRLPPGDADAAGQHCEAMRRAGRSLAERYPELQQVVEQLTADYESQHLSSNP